MRKLCTLTLMLMLAVTALAETYEQAFVACSQESAEAEDYNTALRACLQSKGFTAPAQEERPAAEEGL